MLTEPDGSIIITVPVPGKACSPNFRGHWAQRAKAVSQARDLAYNAAMAVLNPADNELEVEIRHKRTICRAVKPRWRSAVVYVTYHFQRKLRRDADNLLAKLKGTFDGIVDAGVLEDDNQLIHYPIACVYDKHAREKVEIALMEAPDADR